MALRIEIREKGSEAFYRETVNAVTQYRRLLRSPECKLKDYFKNFRIYIGLCAVLLVIFAAMAFAGDADGLEIAGIVLLMAVGVFSAAYLVSLDNALKSMLADDRPAMLTLDEHGAELEKQGGQSIRVAWGNVAFVRSFRESVCFPVKDGMGFIIAVDRRYEDAIFGWIAENRPDIRIIR